MKQILGAAVASLVALNAWAADYKIDSSHSSVGFKVKHLAISSVPGTFGEFKGTFSFDPNNIANSKAEAEIVTKSIATGDRKRDDHLRGGDFLDAQKFPSIKFASSHIDKVSETEFKAHGDLSIHGVTKPVVLNVTYGGAAKDPWGNERAAFVATTRINRKDFGLTWSKTIETGALLVGDDVDITLEVEGVRG